MMDPMFQLARGAQNPPEKLVSRDPWDKSEFKRIIREMGLKVTGQRLSILDLRQEANQPMELSRFNRDKVHTNSRYVLSFNGEIYNLQESI